MAIPVVVDVTGDITVLPLVADRANPFARPGGGSSPTGFFANTIPIGVSTGNAKECASGTIGAKLVNGGNVYALSNNHVFARMNAATGTPRRSISLASTISTVGATMPSTSTRTWRASNRSTSMAATTRSTPQSPRLTLAERSVDRRRRDSATAPRAREPRRRPLAWLCRSSGGRPAHVGHRGGHQRERERELSQRCRSIRRADRDSRRQGSVQQIR